MNANLSLGDRITRLLEARHVPTSDALAIVADLTVAPEWASLHDFWSRPYRQAPPLTCADLAIDAIHRSERAFQMGGIQ